MLVSVLHPHQDHHLPLLQAQDQIQGLVPRMLQGPLEMGTVMITITPLLANLMGVIVVQDLIQNQIGRITAL